MSRESVAHVRKRSGRRWMTLGWVWEGRVWTVGERGVQHRNGWGGVRRRAPGVTLGWDRRVTTGAGRNTWVGRAVQVRQRESGGGWYVCVSGQKGGEVVEEETGGLEGPRDRMTERERQERQGSAKKEGRSPKRESEKRRSPKREKKRRQRRRKNEKGGRQQPDNTDENEEVTRR